MALTIGIRKVLAPYLFKEVLSSYTLKTIEEIEELEQKVMDSGLAETAFSYKEFIDNVNNMGEGGYTMAYLKGRLAKHKHLLSQLQDKKIRPSVIVGSGYFNPREPALECLHGWIASGSLEVVSGGMLTPVNLSNYAHHLRNLMDSPSTSNLTKSLSTVL